MGWSWFISLKRTSLKSTLFAKYLELKNNFGCQPRTNNSFMDGAAQSRGYPRRPKCIQV